VKAVVSGEKAMNEKAKEFVAVLGTGLMGFPMVERLLSQGHHVIAYNRTRDKAAPLEDSGAQIADLPEEAFQQAGCAILMLTDAQAVRSVALSDQARPRLEGVTVVQMSTISPGESREIAAEVERSGGGYLEAPVLGSIPQVRQGELLILAGGKAELLEERRPLLDRLGSIHHIGSVGQAASLKLALNHLIAAQIAGFSLSLGMVQRSGVSTDQFMEILRDSALYAPAFEKKLTMMLSREFGHPTFPSRHLLKDVELILQEAKHEGLETEALEGVKSLLEETVRRGQGDADYSALFETIVPPLKK